MRLWLIVFAGLLCLGLVSCPSNDEYEDQQTTIDDEGMRQPDFAQEETPAEEGDEAAMPAEGEDEAATPAEGEEGAEMNGGDEGEGAGAEGADEGGDDSEMEEGSAGDDEEEADEPEGDESEEGEGES